MRRFLIAALLLVLLPITAMAQQNLFVFDPTGSTRWVAPDTPFAFRQILKCDSNAANCKNLVSGNLFEAGANTTGIANGGTAGAPNPQTLAVYNFCDGILCATGSESFEIKYLSNAVELNSTATGTGAARLVHFAISGTRQFSIGAGVITPATANSKDLGDQGHAWNAIYNSGGIYGARTKSLTDGAAAVAVMRVAAASGGSAGGEVVWEARSTDATDYRSLVGRIRFTGVNKGGTATCSVGVVGTDLLASSNANTLACTWTNVASTAYCDLSVTCTDNTAAAQTMSIGFRPDIPYVGALATLTVTFP